MKLIILNLDRGVTEEALKALFEEFGTVQSCDLILDKATGGSKGFGFVEMPNHKEAKAAITNLHNKKFGINRIRVKKAQNPN